MAKIYPFRPRASRYAPPPFFARKARHDPVTIRLLAVGLVAAAGMGWTAANDGRNANDPTATLAPAASAPTAAAIALIEPKPLAPRAAVATVQSRFFGTCHTGGGENCVVDGDTAWIDGEKVRLAGIDAPETHPARCSYEAALGGRATERLRSLLNSGAVAMIDNEPAYDRYGRRLAIVTVDGRSIGATLIAEGLARPWEGYRRPWCDT